MKKVLCALFALGALPSCGEKQKDPAPIKVAQPMEKAPEPVKAQAKPQQKEKAPMRHTTDSGLIYEITQEAPANAAMPKKGNKVQVHYTGWLADEHGNPIMTKKFDSSVDRGQPFEFNVGMGQVIRGWDEGVIGMKQGEKRRLTIPANLGYGSRAISGAIPANSTLVFDVELLKA